MVGILLRVEIQWKKSTNILLLSTLPTHCSNISPSIHSFFECVCLFVCTFKSRQPSHHRPNKKFVSYFICIFMSFKNSWQHHSKNLHHPCIQSPRKSSRFFRKRIVKSMPIFPSTSFVYAYNSKAMSQIFDKNILARPLFWILILNTSSTISVLFVCFFVVKRLLIFGDSDGVWVCKFYCSNCCFRRCRHRRCRTSHPFDGCMQSQICLKCL